jgi:hypothetical protein
MHGLNHSFLRMESKRQHTGWTSQSRGGREREKDGERSISRDRGVVVLYWLRATRERRRGGVCVHECMCMCMVALFSQRENRTGEAAMSKRPAGRPGRVLPRPSRKQRQRKAEENLIPSPSNMRIYQEFKILDHSPCCSLQINPTSYHPISTY